MKHTLTLSMVLIVSVSHAQSWNAGIKTDLNFSNIKGKGMSTSFTSGYQVGVFAAYNWNKKWGLRPELLFSQNNTKKADNFMVFYNLDGNSFANDDIKLSYVTVPLLVTYKLTDMFTVMAGPQCGFLVYADEELLRDNGYAFTKTVVSATAGLQFNISAVGVYLRYSHDISNVNNIDDRYKWRSQQIQAGVAIKLYQSKRGY